MLDEARKLLDAMERRHQDRLAKGNIGEWQTELNECRRILEYLYSEVRELREKR